MSKPGSRGSSSRIGVLIVDDHEVFAASLARTLADEDDIVVLGTAGNADDALLMLAPEVDVVLCDHRLVGRSGIEVAGELRRRSPTVQVVMLTATNDDSVAIAAIEAGCAGFVTKSQSLAEVLAAVRAAAKGESVVSPALLARLLPRLGRRAGPRPELTARELEVLGLMADGRSNQAIADDLGLARDTVRNHVANILTKLDAHSKLEAVANAVRRGLVTVGAPDSQA